MHVLECSIPLKNVAAKASVHAQIQLQVHIAHLMTKAHKVVRQDECFEDDHPVFILEPLGNQVRQNRHPSAGVVGDLKKG